MTDEEKLAIIIKSTLVVENPKGIPYCVKGIMQFINSKYGEQNKVEESNRVGDRKLSTT